MIETLGAAGFPLLEAVRIEKRFGATRALQGVDFSLRAGEVHALVGANGAGKSTLSRTLAGMHQPDAGSLRVRGELVSFGSPSEAIAKGVTMVTQETSLAGDLSVIENISMPELARPGRLDWTAYRKRARAIADDLQLDMRFGFDDPVSSLSMANRQIVEILKVLALDSSVVLLDEPTTSLSPHECSMFLALVRRLAARGHGVILVTHRMEEIFEATDRVTVMREGRVVSADVPTETLDADALIRTMVGRELEGVYRSRSEATPAFERSALDVRGLRVGSVVRDVSLSVGAGEVVGLGGLVGAGRTEVVEALFGLRAFRAEHASLFGEPFAPRRPLDAIRAGVGFIGEDRRRHGLVPDLSVRENLTLVRMSTQKGQLVRKHGPGPDADEVVRRLGLDPARLDDPDILKFSGGMQQKIIIARWLLASPRLLILDEPTRGVDIETRATIYKALADLAAGGAAILVVSSDFEELLGISDRVVVISDGRDVANVPAAFLDIERLTMLAAPRTSAGQMGGLLASLAERYAGSAFWFHRDGDQAFCLDAAAAGRAVPPMRRGEFVRCLHETLARGGPAAAIATVRGRRGQALGHVGVAPGPDAQTLTPSELETLVSQALNPEERAAA